jgi:hypothetical protein
VIDPTGGGVSGNGRYFDVDGNGFLSAIDAVLVINVLNSPAFRAGSGGGAGGEGESGDAGAGAAPESTAVAATASLLAAAPAPAADPGIPAVLYATPDVVIETRAAAPAAQQKTFVQDQALIAVGPEIGPLAPARLETVIESTLTTADDDEPGWDDLLTDLAHDQKHLGWGD